MRQTAAEEDGLLDQAAAALREDHPLALLGLASGLLNALDPRNNNPFDRTADPELPPLGELLDWLVAVGEPEAAALALVMGHLSTDELARTRTVRAVRVRELRLPPWLDDLSRLVVVAAEEIRDELRDSFNVLVHTRLAGHDLSAVALVDFNLGTIVKDCFFADRSLDGSTSCGTNRTRARQTSKSCRSRTPGPGSGMPWRPARGPGRRSSPTTGRPADPCWSGSCGRCRPGEPVSSARTGRRKKVTGWPNGSWPARTAALSPAPRTARSSATSSGTAPGTAMAIRCAGAVRPWRSCCWTGTPARSSPNRSSCCGCRPCCVRSSGSPTRRPAWTSV